MIFTQISSSTKACFLQSSTLEAILKVGIKGIVNTIEALYCLVGILSLGKKTVAQLHCKYVADFETTNVIILVNSIGPRDIGQDLKE